MNKDKKSIALIEQYLQKEQKKARLITVAELAEKLFLKAPQPLIPASRQGEKNPRVSTTDTTVGARLKGQRKKKGELAGHALYPHLRPMYRTVHRRIPRELVFKAIRWVNPDRMFPISRYDKKKLMSLSREEFEEAFEELAKYRREAHVINNRYGQMINMIDSGQLPYYIPYANIPEQRYADLQQYRDRAERLGKGASDWGWELDFKAEEFRQIYENRDFEGETRKLSLDDAKGLWDDGPPPFMRVREGRKNQRLMRAQRRYYDRYNVKFEDEDGRDNESIVVADSEEAAKKFMMQYSGAKGIKGVKKLKRAKMPRKPQIKVREFVAVNAAEVRVGGKGAAAEQNRMPKSRDVRGAHVFLLRQPDGKAHSYLGDRQYTNAVEAGKIQIGPKGAKVDLIFDDEEVDPEIRRWMRATQRGLVPHKGGASRPPEGHSAATPGPSQQVDIFGRPIPGAAPPAAPTAGVGAKPGEEPDATSAAVEKNARIVSNLNDVFAKHNIDPSAVALDPEKDVFDSEYMSNPDNYETIKNTNRGGIHGSTNFTVTMKDGSKWIWKATNGEQYGELVTWALGAALGEQIAPHTEIAMIPWDVLPDQFKASEIGQVLYGDQGGHFQRFESGGPAYENYSNLISGLGSDGEENWRSVKLMDTPEKRHRLFALSIVDSFTRNGDRHDLNALVGPDGGIVAIDNGFADGWHDFNWKNKVWPNQGRFGNFSFNRPAYPSPVRQSLLTSIQNGTTTADEVRTEAREWFRNHWNPAALSDVAAAFVDNPANDIPKNLDQITEEDFINMIDSRYL